MGKMVEAHLKWQPALVREVEPATGRLYVLMTGSPCALRATLKGHNEFVCCGYSGCGENKFRTHETGGFGLT
jgi:hypothetical protein